MPKTRFSLLAAIALASAACAAGPEPIHAGSDRCARCAMIIADVKFAGEAIAGGAVRKYDDIAEIRLDAAEGKLGPPGSAAVYLVDFDSGDLLPGEQAIVLHSPGLRTPMGGGAVAFRSRATADSFVREKKLPESRIVPFATWWAHDR